VTHSGPAQAEAVRLYWSRAVGIATPLTVLALVAFIAWHLVRGDRSWIMVGEALVVLLAIAWVSALYFGHYRKVCRWRREVADTQAEVVADEESLSLAVAGHVSNFRWDQKLELLRLPKAWLVVGPRGEWAAIPTAGMPAEMQEFVVAKVQSGGGKCA
jgi:uncharacterized membrane protein